MSLPLPQNRPPMNGRKYGRQARMMWDLIGRAGRANRKSGFTLIELLVVVAIIGLLATFALPRVFEAINKAKGGIGGADLNTISSAMERYYFDSNKYPNGRNLAETVDLDVDVALKGDYLKSATTFKNGFGKGYVYFTDANGAYYILVDVGNNTGAFTVRCGATGSEWTATVAGVSTTTPSANFQLRKTDGTTSAPTKTQLAAGCAVSSSATGFDVTTTKLVTN